jgi:hypothetical protein
MGLVWMLNPLLKNPAYASGLFFMWPIVEGQHHCIGCDWRRHLDISKNAIEFESRL